MSDPALAVTIRNLEFAYGNGHDSEPAPLFREFTLGIAASTVVAVMGSSGSGKSTLAKIMVGILSPRLGQVEWGEKFRLPREVIYTDQSPINSVFPWQRVRQNLEWPLRKLHWAAGDRTERVDYLLGLFGLTHRADAFPAHISGGELQRLAVARCLSWKPRCMILDESLSALDRNTKETIIAGLRTLAANESMTVVLITHNLTDALALADRCVILGQRPVQILGDHPISLPFPRDENSSAYRTAQEPLIEILRHGHL